MGVGVALVMAACSPPDRPPALADPLPRAVGELLHPDTVRSERVGAGVWYRYLWSSKGPWAVYAVEADATRCDLTLRVLQAEPRESGGRGHERVTSMVARSNGRVLAAVNADFFTPEGGALGTEVVDGRVTSARERPALAWRRGQNPWMGIVDVEDDSLHAGWTLALHDPDGADSATEIVGGYPELLDSGRRVGDLEVTERPSFAAARNPRTAVGFDASSRRLWLLVVDGRQAPYSVGMTLPELADLLQAFGATDAINLDGGGSSVIVVGGRALNHPSDATGERAVVNALALVRDFAGCRRSAR
ncbi:MAG: phosphodiester glycosidase family protein [Gemmatimonadetes bacterium]|nr:phosphodiester glycosidase family protein [Gemmatimonadota bacterium]